MQWFSVAVTNLAAGKTYSAEECADVRNGSFSRLLSTSISQGYAPEHSDKNLVNYKNVSGENVQDPSLNDRGLLQ
jgi:hypothetical protein